ncbi:aromatic-L-amino-acid decarboxylase-like [Asbolus verrucosus]|uniref:Aromatic-L-amino-acid decarboxylase-like n=1 Tax=Asbolus verrucosus TaxID=1661398 RepID=A0A482W9Y7_ASBVE|nr:aromatic-L-amino-acid decarboxylase-like [Asbolus verrucosus]
MDVEEFRVKGKEMVDYICQYLTNIESQMVNPDVEPGYLRRLLPSEAPQDPEEWDNIMHDVDKKIMPGITHWQHPRFNAFFPSGNSFPSILGDMLSDAIGCIGFSWQASPACTELETIVMDWFGKAIGLPNDFLTSSKGSKGGGGVLQSSASECVLVSMLAARNQAIHQYLKKENPLMEDSAFLPKLIGYCSKEAHSCVEKAAKILLVKLRILEPDENGSLRGETLRAAMEEDKAKGLMPFFVSAILGSTSSCSFDNLEEIGPICKEEPYCWLHVDAAYAGNAFICPELKYLLKGIEYVDSFNTNPNKWLLVNFDCSCLWVRERIRLTHALVVNPLYLQHANADEAIDYRHWGIPLSRRFRSLKLWFVIRKYGLSGLRSYIRNHIKLAKHFEKLVNLDSRFEVCNNVRLGLVCFRLVGTDNATKKLLELINASGQLFVTPAVVRNKYIIRFCVNAEHAKQTDVDYAWEIIKEQAKEVLEEITTPTRKEAIIRPPLKRQKSKRFSFTRSVSKEMYKRSLSKSNLFDGATPIILADSDEDEVEDTRLVPDEDDVFLREIVDQYRNEDKENKYNGVS